MRFMMMIIPGGYEAAASDALPDVETVEAMTKYNEDLTRAGIMLSGEGLHPPATANRVSFKAGKATITDGPFTEAKEAIGGFWIIQAKSQEEAVAWAARCPAGDSDTIEVRRIFDAEDFPQEIQDAAKMNV